MAGKLGDLVRQAGDKQAEHEAQQAQAWTKLRERKAHEAFADFLTRLLGVTPTKEGATIAVEEGRRGAYAAALVVVRQEVEGVPFVWTMAQGYDTKEPVKDAELFVAVPCRHCGEPLRLRLNAYLSPKEEAEPEYRAGVLAQIGARLNETDGTKVFGHTCWQGTLEKKQEADPRNNPVLKAIIREEVRAMFAEGLVR